MSSNSSALNLVRPHFFEMWIFWGPGNWNLALQGLKHMLLVLQHGMNGHDHAADVNPGHSALGLSKGTLHACLEPVSRSTGQHLVDAADVDGVEPHSDMKAIFATVFYHVLIGTNLGSLQGFRGEPLIFI
ncbi:hypothetical protein P7K49_008642 [Saguinus oedipus]|uniref:Uncharacterized protein n=1 Tax=Saguinus oedipus TaxID=9490 RepID=A0ABQ9VYC4_SAGOE|nr:hypothetical protein P7K49_008642 [Saguinus oedipus]